MICDDINNNKLAVENSSLNFISETKSVISDEAAMTDKFCKCNNLADRIEKLRKTIDELEEFDYANEKIKLLSQGKNINEAKQICGQIDEKKAKLKNEMAQLLKCYSRLCKTNLKVVQNNKIYRYYCSVCLIIREDNEYLEEWLNWHINQGIEHFYIYDHGSKKPILQTIEELGGGLQNYVTVHDFSGQHGFAQHEAYNDCLKKYGQESRWIAFIDSDEMIRVKNGKKLTEFLKDYEEFAGLFMTWITYGANGNRKKTNEPLRTRFTKVSPSNTAVNIGKVIVQPTYIKKMLTHNGYVKDGYLVVDEHKEPVDEAQSYKVNATTDLICVDHYYTKSYEEWLNKIKRGSCDPYYSRKYDEFFEFNPDMEYCRENTYPIQEYEISKI